MIDFEPSTVYVPKEDKIGLYNLFIDIIDREQVERYIEELRSLANVLCIDPVSFYEYTGRCFLNEDDMKEHQRYLDEMAAADNYEEEQYWLYNAI